MPSCWSWSERGLRIGEAVALQWGDVDFQGRFLHVQRNYVDGHIYSPKSGRSRRVDMSPHLTETLWTLRGRRKEETLRRGWQGMPDWIFTTAAGTHLDPDNFRVRVWAKIPTRGGLHMIRLHDLRHTFASLLIEQGAPLTYVKEQMGHHSIRVTVDTYGHLVPGGNRAEVDKLDESIPHTQKVKK